MEAFDRVFELIGDEDEWSMTLRATVAVLKGLRAREESSWCLCQMRRYEEALSGLEIVSQRLSEDLGDAQINSDRARCLWRIGKCLLASESEPESSGFGYEVDYLLKVLGQKKLTSILSKH